jgi:hypothetical protein
MSGCGEGQVTAPHIYEPMRFILGFFDCKLDQKQKHFSVFFFLFVPPPFMRLLKFHEDYLEFG